jgi:prephenate dehydratase
MGVLPIENSLHGPVAETHDLLYEAPLSIVSEVTLPIVHCLVAKNPIQVSEVKTLRSNGVAFDQCREFVHATGARCLPTSTTAEAAREVSESDDPTEAAIASAEAASHFGLHVIAPDVGDHTAFTRFVGIAPYTRVAREPRWRTAFSIITDHRPGSLYHALGPFHRHGLNLVQLVSRPIPQSTFRYRFDVIVDGHPLDDGLRNAFAEMREWTREIRIFGSYPATGDH